MKKILFLLKLEWLKVKMYRPFWVLSGAYLAIMLFFAPFVNAITIPQEFLDVKSVLMFPNIWQNLSYWGNWTAFFTLGFLSVLSITNEFSNKTLRQSVISGLSRRDAFLSKVMFILTLSLAATLVFTVIALIIGAFTTETVYFSRVSEGFSWIFRYFLMCFGFSTFALLIGTLLRRSGVSLFLFLTWEFFIEPIIRYAIHMQYIAKNETMHYYPMKAFNNLIPIPFPKAANRMLDNNNLPYLLNIQTDIIIAIIYIALMLYGIYALLQKRDL